MIPSLKKKNKTFTRPKHSHLLIFWQQIPWRFQMLLLVNTIHFPPCLFVLIEQIWCLPKSVPEIQFSSRTSNMPKHMHSGKHDLCEAHVFSCIPKQEITWQLTFSSLLREWCRGCSNREQLHWGPLPQYLQKWLSFTQLYLRAASCLLGILSVQNPFPNSKHTV